MEIENIFTLVGAIVGGIIGLVKWGIEGFAGIGIVGAIIGLLVGKIVKKIL